MKRDDMKLPAETPPKKPLDPVKEGMWHYYWRDPEALQRLLEKLAKEKKDD